jgi:hypothetical protein
MYGPEDVKRAARSHGERERPHPVYGAFMQHEESLSFSRDEVRNTVVPTYMGLVKQIDDHLGRLFAFLRETGRENDTMIVFTSDHGDYLGDHWLGEKELFHDASSRVPLIVFDPRRAADATRGTVQRSLVEAIDLLPTFLDAVGAEIPAHIVEAARCSRCCMAPARSRHGVKPCSASSTIRSARARAPGWVANSTAAAASWRSMAAGSTCTTTASGRNCSIC